MASSFRSHFRHHPPKEQSALDVKSKSYFRPTKSSTSKTEAPPNRPTQQQTTQQPSKLSRRLSRTPSSQQPQHVLNSGNTTKSSLPPPAEHDAPAARSNVSITHTSQEPSSSMKVQRPRQPPVQSPPTIRPPSLVSGSSATSFDSPKTNGLRRKPSTIERFTASKRTETKAIEVESAGMRSRSDGYPTTKEDTDVLNTSLLPQPTPGEGQDGYVGRRLAAESLMSLDAQGNRMITPPITGYAQTATPSTRYTDSPFSHVPTPSSASSYSPGILSISNTAALSKATSPSSSRAAMGTRKLSKDDSERQGLAPVRESSQSSSNSTVYPSESRKMSAVGDRKNTPLSSGPSISRRPVGSNKTVDERERAKRTSLTQSDKVATHIPPELAHLNVDSPPKANIHKPLPPLRPSRNGTPSLTNLKNPSPVVQSDLPRLYTTYHKRTPSQDTPASAASTRSVSSQRAKSRFGLSPKSSSKHPSPRIDSAISPPPSARNFAHRTATPDGDVPDKAKPIRKDSPAVGVTSSPSKSPRFGIFSRKAKPETKPEKSKKEPRRGPAAGTGHEGYGRFGFRARSGSTTSITSVGRSPSAESSTSSLVRPNASRKTSTSSKAASDLDEFLVERLNPIVLRGSGSTTSIGVSGNNATTTPEAEPNLQLLPSAIPNSRGKSPVKRPLGKFRRPSDSSEDDVSVRYPSLAQRRSITRVQSGGSANVREPTPIYIGRDSKQSSTDGYNADASRPQTEDITLHQPEAAREGKEGLWLRPQQSEPVVKPSRKWNFFQRAHASPSKGKNGGLEIEQAIPNAPSALAAQSVAHYALDPVEPVGLEEVERMMLENATSPEASESESNSRQSLVFHGRRLSSQLSFPPGDAIGQDSGFAARPMPPRIAVQQNSHEGFNTSPAKQLAEAESTATQVAAARDNYASRKIHTPEISTQSEIPDLAPRLTSTPERLQATNSSPRQPRLSPVGRIPRVVSKRDRDRKLSEHSFSRPFARPQPKPTVKPPGELYNRIRHSRELTSPLDLNSQPVSSTSADSGSHGLKSSVQTDQPSLSTQRTSIDIHNPGQAFLMFPQRKDSEQSYSSSSCNASWIASMMSAQPPQEDDIWNEYNDLLDDVMPEKTPLSTGSSFGAPFQYSSMLHESSPATMQHSVFQEPQQLGYQDPPRASTVPAVLSVPQQINRFMQPSMSPLTPNTISDFVATYQDRSSTTSALGTPHLPNLNQPRRTSIPSARNSASSPCNSRQSGHSRSVSLSETSLRNSQHSIVSKSSGRFRDTQLLDIAEERNIEKTRTANLRFGALMASKWLSFGRVLFSPAHNEMQLANEPRVLIVDGLGSDWSYYVALSYPGAAVYNLRPISTDPSADSLPTSKWKPLTNHRHIRHDSISDPFPFPKGMFTAVVFRFPMATTDHAYHACISECKRVLRPGGHLEVAVLDMDLMNMGSRARKAVRGLKTRMQQQNPHVSLRNLSDTLVGFIGRRGFEEVQRCIVGVPAAGHIPRSQDFGSITSSDESSKKPLWQREEKAERTLSFSDLLDDTRSSRVGPVDMNDEGITKMMSKVGRWWYSACYETSLLPKDKSIWTDHALLRECERQGTGFRLLICCAQKPTQPRRRTMSV